MNGIRKQATLVLLASLVFSNSWATIEVTPDNLSQHRDYFSVSTHFSVGGTPSVGWCEKTNEGLIKFEIRAQKKFGWQGNRGIGRLTLVDGSGYVASVPVAGMVEDEDFFYRFEVKRDLLKASNFRFNMGENYQISLGDWRSPDNPITADFKVLNSCVAPGDTFVVELNIISKEQATFYVGPFNNLSWKLNQENGEHVAAWPNSSHPLFSTLDFEPGTPRVFEFRIPARNQSFFIDDSAGLPLEEGKYKARCKISCYEEYGFYEEFELEVKANRE